jgi:hypothetical protein
VESSTFGEGREWLSTRIQAFENYLLSLSTTLATHVQELPYAILHGAVQLIYMDTCTMDIGLWSPQVQRFWRWR